MSDLNTAIAIAIEAHQGQVDKAGEPYILHPLRVMLAMPDEESRIVAVLHDVAEDDEFGWQDIHEGGFGTTILDAIDALTRREGEDYFDYVERAGNNRIARKVKLADLADNLSPQRLASINDRQIKRYIRAQAMLLTTQAA